jgi:hypothetical protein
MKKRDQIISRFFLSLSLSLSLSLFFYSVMSPRYKLKASGPIPPREAGPLRAFGPAQAKLYKRFI